MVVRVKNLKISNYGLWAFGVIAFAALLRIVLTVLGWPLTNSDEDTMGLMALHIAFKGEHPLFFYGQNYMGAIEAYLGAAAFRLFGVSVFSLRLGTILLFTLFLTSMYFLASLLYNKKVALVTIILLSLGSIVMLDTEVITLGGYPELLLFGALALLLVSWLISSYSQNVTRRGRMVRYIVYGCWGLIASVGFWSDFLMAVFILMSGLLLLLFCWRELLKGAIIVLLLGVAIGIFPLVIYNIYAPKGQDIWAALQFLHSAYSLELSQNHAFQQLPYIREIRGTMLVSLPSITGTPALCSEVVLRLYGYPTLQPFECPPVQGHVGLATVSILWSLGFLTLGAIAVVLAIRSLWKLRRNHLSGQPWSLEERQAILRQFSRLALLGTAALTLYLFISSPVSAVYPTNSRYLIGLLIAFPALIAPLLNGFRIDAAPVQTVDTTINNLNAGRGSRFPLTFNSETVGMIVRRGILLLIGVVLLLGTISSFFEIPTVQVSAQKEDALISDLLRINATHIYSEYWTCGRIIFQTREQIICASLGPDLNPHRNRYAAYYYIVKNDPKSAYAFPINSPQDQKFMQWEITSRIHYQHYTFDGYHVYKPVSP